MSHDYSDATMAEWSTGASAGAARAARYLSTVPEDVRAALVNEGTIMSNMNAGFRWADGIEEAVRAYLTSGIVPNRYTQMNAEILRKERERR